MRTYLAAGNLVKALALAVPVTLLSYPRFREADVDAPLYALVAMVLMTLSAGAVTAWGGQGGMVGAFPGRRRLLLGLAAGAGLALLMLPLRLFIVDPIVHPIIVATGNTRLLRLTYPGSHAGRMAVMLWSAGFETLFFTATAMAFAARLSQRQWVAVLLAVSLRVFALLRHAGLYGIEANLPLLCGLTVVSSLSACLLFARCGLPGTMLYAAGLDAHLWLMSAGDG